MKSPLDLVLSNYDTSTELTSKLAVREIIQNIVLIGLSKGGFFNTASFYGGTSLRIFYGLNRFSEDLDFTLDKPCDEFSFDPYIPSVIKVAESYGLKLEISTKEKCISTGVKSAYAKVNTYSLFASLQIDSSITEKLHKDEVLKVKFEVATNPEPGYNDEYKYITSPELASVKVLDLPSLFAGKLAALIGRTYKNNVKGRDFYDFLYFMNRNIKPNMDYLRYKLIKDKIITENEVFNTEKLRELLINRFESVNFNMAINDIKKFTLKSEDFSIYTKEIFIEYAKRFI